MAAGDLLVEEWQHEINGLLVGPDCTWGILKLSGWLGRTVSSGASRYGQAAGSAEGVDSVDDRIITIRFEGQDTDDGPSAFAACLALETAWPENTTTELHALLPELGHVYVVGRCGDLVFTEFDETTPLGEIEAVATFIAHDPTRHEVP